MASCPQSQANIARVISESSWPYWREIASALIVLMLDEAKLSLVCLPLLPDHFPARM